MLPREDTNLEVELDVLDSAMMVLRDFHLVTMGGSQGGNATLVANNSTGEYAFLSNYIPEYSDPEAYKSLTNNLAVLKKKISKQYENYDNKDELVQNKLEAFIASFHRRIDKAYGDEGFDLSVISQLKTDELFLFTESAKNDFNFRQRINIIAKVVNQFELTRVMADLHTKYPDDIIAVKKTSYYKPSTEENKNQRYKKYLTTLEIMRGLSPDKKEIIDQGKRVSEQSSVLPGSEPVRKDSRAVIYVKGALNPRIKHLSSNKTPKEKKHNLSRKQRAINMLLKGATTFGLGIISHFSHENKLTAPSKVPGPIYLGPLPRFSDMENLRSLNIKTSVSIEEKLVSERMSSEERASVFASDFIDKDMNVVKIETPDLTPMELSHTKLAAKKLYESVSKLQPGENCYIHCKAGASRSATTLLSCYLMYASEFSQMKNITPQNKTFFEEVSKVIADDTKGVKDFLALFSSKENPDRRHLLILKGQRDVLEAILKEQRVLKRENKQESDQAPASPSFTRR